MRENRCLSLFQANAMYLLAAAALVALQVLSTWLASTGRFQSTAVSSLLTAGYYVLALGAPALLSAANREYGWDAMRLLPLSFGRALLIALLAGVVLLFVNGLSLFFYALVEATGGVVYETYIELPRDTAGILRMFLLIAVLPGVFEELLFRGALLNAWEARGGKRAVLVTTLLFAFLHGSLLGLPSELIAGAVMGLLALRLGSVYASMVFHTAYNGIAYGIMLYARDLPAETGTVTQQAGGIGELLSLLPGVALYGAVAFLLYRACVRGTRPLAPRPERVENMDWQAIVVLASALITCAYPFVMDVLQVYCP